MLRAMLTHSFRLAAAVFLSAVGVTSVASAQTAESLDHTDLSYFVDEGVATRPIQTVDDWQQRRRVILKSVQEAMGPLPSPQPRTPLDVRVIEEVETPKYVRRKITYVPEVGDLVPAYLLLPRGESQRRPAMLCLHQTTDIGKGEPAGLGGLDSLHYAHELAERGFVCLVPDYPSFGDYPYEFDRDGEPYASGSMKAIWNNIRGVDLLVELPEVDSARIGVIGHSLGGHNAIFTAVFDERLKAVVTSCGFTGFQHYYRGNLQGWTSDRYMPRIREVYGNDPGRVPFDFHELIAAIAPRAVFVSAPLHDDNFEVQGVREVVARAAPIFRLHGVEARLRAEYPDAPHEFPAPVREQAYDWLQHELGEVPGN
jgi:acetyl esterase/lipase